uniref:Telomere repeat binding bouquet formation protein 2 n=1 Tax=Mola mola TaxID=94237 RepID=A0A3Q3WW85_MOLML
MFRNKSAWFSSSVSPACYSFWTLEGGSVAGWTTADYLFSEDAACPDTLRIYESKDYLWNKVVVFHSLFLSTCEKRRSVKSVYIGHYVLPPLSVQAGECHWGSIKLHVISFSAGYISMDSLQKYSGDLRDYRPRCFPCANCKAHCCLQHA